ncbi:hypothetical protein [Coleofasciculus sp. G2-EDA-02]
MANNLSILFTATGGISMMVAGDFFAIATPKPRYLIGLTLTH